MVFLSRVVSGAGSYKRKQKFGSVFAPEGRLAIEIQSSFLSFFFHEQNEVYFGYVGRECF